MSRSDLLIVQLGDLHIRAGFQSPAVDKWPAICSAVVAALDQRVGACVIIFCGDAANGGLDEEFAVASELLEQLKTALRDRDAELPIITLTVPGNHDCNLLSPEQKGRSEVRKLTEAEMPPEMIKTPLLQAQESYFAFAKTHQPEDALSSTGPFYQHNDLVIAGKRVRFHLINSSWTSEVHEDTDLRYPLDAFDPPAEPEADYAVAVLHHPIHWFLMPQVRDFLCHKIRSSADLVLTGHEHRNEANREGAIDGPQLDHIEAGVLDDPKQPGVCTFNLIRLSVTPPDGKPFSGTATRLEWNDGAFRQVKPPVEGGLIPNPQRTDKVHDFKPDFSAFLDQFEDPWSHPRVNELRLSQLFEFPDLLKPTVEPAEVRSGFGPDGDKDDDKNAALVKRRRKRIRGSEVLAELDEPRLALITGGDKSGKTGMSKRLTAAIRRAGRVPLLLEGAAVNRSGKAQTLRNKLHKVAAAQYAQLKGEDWEALDKDRRVVVIDDAHKLPSDPAARAEVLSYLADVCGQVFLIASDELYLESSGAAREDATLLMAYDRYEICDFGHVRLEELVSRWMKLGRPDADPAALRADVLELCEQLQRLLSLGSLPPTPWLILALLEQTETPDAVAAKSGSYGHLYQAIITVALSRVPTSQLDIGGKFTYLSELAYLLWREERASLTMSEADKFHQRHAEKYDISFDQGRVREDLARAKMLRVDGDEVSFRHKYVYAFFVAWWLSEHIHEQEAQDALKKLCERLHHDTSANVLVFLSHFSKAPVVLQEMRTAAAAFFADAPLAVLDKDVKELNDLRHVGGSFVLSGRHPEVNRRLIQDSEDERRAREGRPDRDGRHVDVNPDEDEEEDGYKAIHRELRDIGAALRTSRILGQVLRNGATSIAGEEKLAVMREAIDLNRRLLGNVLAKLVNLEDCIAWSKERIRTGLLESSDYEGDADADAEALAERFWFDLHWAAAAGIVRVSSAAVGMRQLDQTYERLKAADSGDGELVYELVDVATRLARRSRDIPGKRIVDLHKKLVKSGNNVARIVLEGLVAERLDLFDTEISERQRVCTQLGIQDPPAMLDPGRKLYRSNWTSGKKQ